MSDVMTTLRAELESMLELAGKATSGPWYSTGADIWIDTREQVCCGRGVQECCGNHDIIGGQEQIAQSGETDAAFIAASNPAVVSALLRVAMAAEDVYASARDEWKVVALENALESLTTVLTNK